MTEKQEAVWFWQQQKRHRQATGHLTYWQPTTSTTLPHKLKKQITFQNRPNKPLETMCKTQWENSFSLPFFWNASKAFSYQCDSMFKSRCGRISEQRAWAVIIMRATDSGVPKSSNINVSLQPDTSAKAFCNWRQSQSLSDLSDFYLHPLIS